MATTGETITAAQMVRRARRRLGMSQAQLAQLLRISVKAVQSYEQGWRTPSKSLSMHLLTLLALQAGHAQEAAACWERQRCPATTRDQCSAYLLSRGHFCWLATTGCGGGGAGDPSRCLSCSVTAPFLATAQDERRSATRSCRGGN